jgi:hypothetical protein
MEDYETLPDSVNLDITKEAVEKVAWHLFGSAGPGRFDTQDIQHWLL